MSTTFTLAEARALLPELKRMLAAANDELEQLSGKLLAANSEYEKAEAGIAAVKTSKRAASGSAPATAADSATGSTTMTGDASAAKAAGAAAAKAAPEEAQPAQEEQDELKPLRQARQRFQISIEKLSLAQNEYLSCMNKWVDKISETGVILRDLHTGLLDFPARDGKFEYYLCWNLNDSDLEYWHLTNDGFIGRRPLAVLAEYI